MSSELIGYILTLDAIFTWALASLVYKWGLGKTEPKANLFFRLCCTSLGTFIFSLIFSNYLILRNLNNSELISYLIACLISGVSVTIGDLMYYMSLKKIDASRTYPLVQTSLLFVIFFSIFLFNEEITCSIVLGGTLILSSVFILSIRDKSEKINVKRSLKERISEDLIIGVLLAIGTAFFWAIAYVSFNQARILTGDVFISNFFRVGFGMIAIAVLGIFQREYYAGFKKENRINLKYFLYIGIAGMLSLGFADAIYIKAAEINGLILTSTFTANTPMVQQILSILILKEKFRKRFIVAIILIIIGNYVI
ncbi:MAG: EamA family transporter, partial [Candidatus Lokiarchaeota archaeon]|nr:EamA family transporter [Candidatus Lokiarchaeota archaeon]